jgi:hypothetical protein
MWCSFEPSDLERISANVTDKKVKYPYQPINMVEQVFTQIISELGKRIRGSIDGETISLTVKDAFVLSASIIKNKAKKHAISISLDFDKKIIKQIFADEDPAKSDKEYCILDMDIVKSNGKQALKLFNTVEEDAEIYCTDLADNGDQALTVAIKTFIMMARINIEKENFIMNIDQHSVGEVYLDVKNEKIIFFPSPSAKMRCKNDCLLNFIDKGIIKI